MDTRDLLAERETLKALCVELVEAYREAAQMGIGQLTTHDELLTRAVFVSYGQPLPPPLCGSEDIQLRLSDALGAAALSGTKEPQMTNTDRLAQALRAVMHHAELKSVRVCCGQVVQNHPEEPPECCGQPDDLFDVVTSALAEHDALASLAPAAVEGDAVERAWAAGNAEAAKRSQYGKPEPMDEDDRACLQAALAAAFPALTAQVAALTAQCAGLSAQVALLKTEAMVSEFEDGSIDVFWKDDKRSALLNIPSDREAPTSFAFKERSAIAAGNGEGV